MRVCSHSLSSFTQSCQHTCRRRIPSFITASDVCCRQCATRNTRNCAQRLRMWCTPFPNVAWVAVHSSIPGVVSPQPLSPQLHALGASTLQVSPQAQRTFLDRIMPDAVQDAEPDTLPFTSRCTASNNVVNTGITRWCCRCVFIHDPRVQGACEAWLPAGCQPKSTPPAYPSSDCSFFFPDMSRDPDSLEVSRERREQITHCSLPASLHRVRTSCAMACGTACVNLCVKLGTLLLGSLRG